MRGERQIYAGRLKRITDVALTLLLIVLTSPVLVPLMIGAMLLVAIDGHSPIYRQKRIGRHGRVFELLKIRTMVHDADTLLSGYLESNPGAKAEWEHHQKLRYDPRITRIGRFLRKSSLDELPQLWNVLRGDMSLVGPRPMMVDQAPLYPGRDYFSVRPGITGPWQVSDRNLSSFSDRARFDDDYVKTMSLRNDLCLLMRTFTVVFRGTGC